ncbi:type III secretion protein HrpZ [Pseudomonas sp. RTC3]|uniref:type III secretion protein HrpZ n=1 Tax=Pseudomonas sp. 5C2 TaxID=3048588 RepID=UPI002AB3C6E2|nr:type III secretion protein HrpZ [Pseudomonas sp. 5C2]MDY7564676.1 type III secretion protein HrpZ [Pseudomonas sp. 5C2]MEB0060677.1 type III secretion protein HrpZ [Pseudomonas sp. RTC3]MEB0240864.1 type III secretion protein HrpZ [Pseudomonas sp. 5C2]
MVSLNVGNMANAVVGTVIPVELGRAATSPKSLTGVIDKLAEALTKGGDLKDSPLGKMVASHMPQSLNGKLLGGEHNLEAIKSGLSSLIHEKLGDNFGAAADLGIGGGSGGGEGKNDMMSQVLNGLGKASLDNLLDKKGEGTNFSSGDKPALDKIAQFMDQNPTKFPAPDSGSWKNELKEDNFLNKQETGVFRAALDVVGGQMGGKGGDDLAGGLGSAADGAGSSTAAQGSNTPLDLEQLLSGQSGGQNGSSRINDSDGNQSPDIGQILGGLIQKGLEATLGGGGSGKQGNGLMDLISSLAPQLAQHDLLSSAADTASSIIGSLTQSSSSNAIA